MESNVYKNSKPDYSNFVALTLQNRMPWKMLSSILFNLSPTLTETKEIICILLKELEALHLILQKKDKELEKYQSDGLIPVTQNSKINDHNITLETESVPNDNKGIKEQEQSFSKESETMDDEIEVLEVVKESIDEEIYIDVNKGPKSCETCELDSGNKDAVGSLGHIDAPFVRNAKISDQELEASAQEEESCLKTETTSSNGNKDDKHITEENENDLNEIKEIDNKWYTFVANDKKCNSGQDVTVESEESVVNKARKRKYHCIFCQKAFQTSSSLKSHVRIHTGEVPFECKTCSKRFKTKGELKQHERIHTGEVPFECKTCSKRFKTKYEVRSHERIHTGEVPFECRTCKKRFKAISNLRIHEIIHTGELPYECKSCKKRFSQIGNLKKHERIHTGEVPFECKTCQKRFRVKCNLKIHESIHTGEEPYKCKTWGKTFKQRAALIYHFKMTHQLK